MGDRWVYIRHPREAKKKTEDIQEKLPWFQLEKDYSGTESGRTASLYFEFMIVSCCFPSTVDTIGVRQGLS